MSNKLGLAVMLWKKRVCFDLLFHKCVCAFIDRTTEYWTGYLVEKGNDVQQRATGIDLVATARMQSLYMECPFYPLSHQGAPDQCHTASHSKAKYIRSLHVLA